jgi:Icc-related predicted phosphoesterase
MTDPSAPLTHTDTPPVRILTICDEVDGRLYGPGLVEKRGQYDLLVSCGDLPPYYIDFVASTLNLPVYGVHGNHDASLARPRDGEPDIDWGMEELHGRIVQAQGLLIGGFDGCRRYNKGEYQYTERGMRFQIARMLPQLLANKLRHGRYLDILVTHAPPRHIHDQEDRCHQGFEAFRWFLQTFRPSYHLHGHIHIYDKRTTTRTQFHETVVLNAYPYRDLMVPAPQGRQTALAEQPAMARQA